MGSPTVEENAKRNINNNNENGKYIRPPTEQESAVYSTFVVILEVLSLLAKILASIIESTYKIFSSSPPRSVRGEIVLITGTGHGIGKNLALQYAELGAKVICVDLNKENNEKTAKEIEERYSSTSVTYQCDVSDPEAVKNLHEKVKKEVGIVSILVNNAGIMPCKDLLSYSPQEVTKMFGVNVYAHIWLLQNFLPDMLAKNHGHIVALSSMAGMVGIENLVPYCGTKFAVRGMMEALNEEIRMKTKDKSNVKFTVIYPYMVDTGLCKKPIIKFPSLLSMVKPEEAAKQIIDAQRKNVTEQSIPSTLLTMNYVFRLFPYKSAYALKDFLGSTLEAHDS